MLSDKMESVMREILVPKTARIVRDAERSGKCTDWLLGVDCSDDGRLDAIGALPVKRLFADYYTTVVRSEGFGVKRHSRMQACGRKRRRAPGTGPTP